MPRPAAIFDLDGTLLGGRSAEAAFVRRALAEGGLRPAGLLRGLTLACAALWRQGAPLGAAAKAYVAGADCQRLESLGVASVRDDVVPRLRPAMVAELERRRREGRAIVLLTGTLDFLADEVARFLQADLALACRLERRDGRFTGRVHFPYPYGSGKAQVLAAAARRHDLDLGTACAYANRASDVVHLRLVAAPHAVAPDRGLRRAARRHGWRVLEVADVGRAQPPRSAG